MDLPEPSISILIVEDEQVISEVMSAMIARRFPTAAIYSAANGKIGVELFREHMPLIVITDIQMPEMDGIEMAKVIKSINNATKFIVLTAYSNTGYLEKFGAIGFDDFLSKPIEFDKLFRAINRCIASITPEHLGKPREKHVHTGRQHD